MVSIDIFKIANMYNNDGLTLKEIGEKIGMSKSTVQRRLRDKGWHFDKATGKYKYQEVKEMAEENLQTSTNSKIENMDEKKVQSIGKIVNRTYAISENIDRAIRIKAAIENKKPIDIIREALENYIEDKYKNM